MSVEDNNAEECVSKRPWGEVLNRSLKLFTFNFAKEGGRSVGRVIFYVILGALAIFALTYLVDMATGWFSALFDFWPFNREETAAETKWYCKFNPLC